MVLRWPSAMSALLLSILGLSAGLQHCPMWKEITPCTCRLDTNKTTTIACEKMASYDQVVDVLRGRFAPTDRVSLRLAFSNLPDLRYRRFNELNMSIENLKLNHDHVQPIEPETFEGLSKVAYLSLADSVLEEVPEKLWKKMPNIKTLDLGRTKIKYISDTSFEALPYLECLVLPGNQISRMDTHSMPSRLQKVHLGRNYIRDLNNTLRNLSALGWLFVNSNELTNLEDELPVEAPDLRLIHASHNRIEKLPQQLKNYPLLESLFFQHNRLKSLDGVFSNLKNLIRAVLEHNQINTITEDDFAQSEMLESLLLGHNELTTLNNSLLNLRKLNFLNMTFNWLTEFSFQEVAGLQELRSIDLSHNQITTLVGPATNLVEWNIKLTELKLDHNRLETLNGALSGLPELLRLNLSFNRLKRISPDDLIGLDQLRLLDISHNHLTTLEETSKTFLPRLSELRASYNYLTVLERDFHGLPVLCHADLSNNQIIAFGRDLVTKTRCKIEHGVHEGTWDTLKIYLQDNPILCDAALPEIMSSMEVNHANVYGVTNCPPVSDQPEQPITKPAYVDDVQCCQSTKLAVELRTNALYTIENDQPAPALIWRNLPTFLPRLSELRASYNYLTILERDFHGLPVLCHADLSNNQIIALGRDLVTKTRCKIEHGVHEGTWDTLKIYLQDNPILCDAALPEIMSAMEINHTRLYGVSHCPPLSEQPVTSRPSAYLGYVPGTTPSLPAAISAGHGAPGVQVQTVTLAKPGQREPNPTFAERVREPAVELRINEQYTVENDQPAPARLEKPVALTLQKPDLKIGTGTAHNDVQGSQVNLSTTTESTTTPKSSESVQIDAKAQTFDPVQQGQQINNLASQIEELRTRIDQLTSQNQLLLSQQFKATELTTSVPKENLTELRKLN